MPYPTVTVGKKLTPKCHFWFQFQGTGHDWGCAHASAEALSHEYRLLGYTVIPYIHFSAAIPKEPLRGEEPQGTYCSHVYVDAGGGGGVGAGGSQRACSSFAALLMPGRALDCAAASGRQPALRLALIKVHVALVERRLLGCGHLAVVEQHPAAVFLEVCNIVTA